MIEVEKKFQPTEEQLKKLLDDSEFVKEVTLHDLYYDYPDHRMYKQRMYLRNRNDRFELKKEIVGQDGSHEEIEGEENIRKYFKLETPFAQFLKENFVETMDFVTKRIKYKKGEFSIDIDELNFGYNCVEIELLVDNQSQAESAYEKIIALAKNYGFEIKKVPKKRNEYFRIVKPEVYKELYESEK